MRKRSLGPSAAEIRTSLRDDTPGSVPEWRIRRRAWSRPLEARPPREIVRLASELANGGGLWERFTAYELIANHPGAITALTPARIRRLGRGLSDWASVDTFVCYVAGPAWRDGVLPSREVHAWLDSRDRWQRRAAVVCTVALNVRARGGRIASEFAHCAAGHVDLDAARAWQAAQGAFVASFNSCLADFKIGQAEQRLIVSRFVFQIAVADWPDITDLMREIRPERIDARQDHLGLHTGKDR